MLKKVELYRSYIKTLNEMECDEDDNYSCSDNTSQIDSMIGTFIPEGYEESSNPRRRKLERKMRARHDEVIELAKENKDLFGLLGSEEKSTAASVLPASNPSLVVQEIEPLDARRTRRNSSNSVIDKLNETMAQRDLEESMTAI